MARNTMAHNIATIHADQTAHRIDHLRTVPMICWKTSDFRWVPAAYTIGRVASFTVALVLAIAAASFLPGGVGQSIRIFVAAIFE